MGQNLSRPSNDPSVVDCLVHRATIFEMNVEPSPPHRPQTQTRTRLMEARATLKTGIRVSRRDIQIAARPLADSYDATIMTAPRH
jgi:hypothetical protein